jgi:cytosine/creatinine deaminase
MLVLARTRDQTIMIGDEIEVTVVDVRGEKVRLGISAPRKVPVHRKEVYLTIQKENKSAAELTPKDVGNIAAVKPAAAPDPFMLAAIEEAKIGLAEGGLPIGSVLVRDGQIIARGHNRRVQNNDPMAHAEIDCLTRAGRQKTYRDTILYSTLMPCHLCSGAAVQFGVPKVVVGESVNFTGAPHDLTSHGVEVVDLHDPECIRMMREFIAAKPELWNEDIGR